MKYRGFNIEIVGSTCAVSSEEHGFYFTPKQEGEYLADTATKFIDKLLADIHETKEGK